MWDIDYDDTRFIPWLEFLPPEDHKFILAVLEAMATSREHPWYFGPQGVEGVRVRKLVDFGTLMYMALLQSPDGEIAIVFSVDEWEARNTACGEIKLLLYGRLKDLRKRYSIEAVAYAILEDQSWQK